MTRKVNWALAALVACAGLWCSFSPSTTVAADGGKAVQVTLVNVDGKPLTGAHVQFLRDGGKPLNAVMTGKDTWLLKNASGKVTVSVRNGREGGIIELPLSPNNDEMASYVVHVSAHELRAELVKNDGEAPPSIAKPPVNVRWLQQSIRKTVSEANRPAGPSKGHALPLNTTDKNSAVLVVPGNDLCASATSVSVPSVTSGTTVDATLDSVGTCGTSNTAPGVWYTFTGSGTSVTASTCTGTTYDSKISVFSGSCGSMTCVGGNDDTTGCGTGAQSSVTFCATAGVQYLVLVHGFSSGTGTFDLTISSGAACGPPPNDLCTAAIAMGPLPDSETVNNAFAANDPQVAAGCGSAPQNNTTWYSVVGDGTTYTASTCNAETLVSDTELVVYCGDCATPLCIGGDDDSCSGATGENKSIFSWCTQPGATYLIAVGNFSGSGVVKLDVTSSGTACSGAIGCLTITGACCNAGTCTGTTTQTACEGGGGTWFIGESCPAFACPGVCVGDTCATAASIASLPFTGAGNTCDCVNDYDTACPFTGSTSKDAVYSYTPSSDQCVDVTLCNGNTDYDTKVYVYAGSCAGSAIACNDDSCSSPLFSDYVSSLSGVALTGGTTYYFVVDGYAGACGNFVLDINQVACPAPCGICPPGGIAENEPDCGLPDDTVNGGCNSVPAVFGSITCGQTVCGTSAWDGSSRDTDWYQVTFATQTEFTWSVQAEFAAVIGMVETSPLGNPDCATATALDPFAVTTNCGVGTVTRCVPPGTYWFFVAPDFNGPTFTCGADYTASLSCVDCVAPTCSGDTCATAEVIPSTPFSGTGDTCICGDDYDEICPFDASGSPDKVYVYTPAVDECIDISMCSGSAYDTKVYVYAGSCGTYQSGTAIACNDDACTSPNFGSPYVSRLGGINLTGGQTYYIVVDGYAGDCGNYTLDIGPCCQTTCSPGATHENELNCGLPEDTVNGGCNSVPPVFSPIACGESICGTGAFDGATRDTDWYQIIVPTSTRFTWTANSEFPSLTGPVVTVPAGSGDCATATAIDPALFGVPCTQDSVVTECLPAGTYWFFMGATFDAPVACGAGYEVSLGCEPCVIPLGACCRPTGACEDGIAEAACENWQGENTVCSGVSCPQPPGNDDCADAITVAVPSVTFGSNELSNPETGLPATCGTSITGGGVWYKVVGNGNSITVDTCGAGTDYDSKISVFCPNCSAPACVGGNDDFCGNTGFQSSVTWCSAVGETYLILVHGFGGATGPFELTVTNGPACSNPASCVVAPICGGGGDCCVGNPGVPGCNDATCCETVCACDSFCCDVEWDDLCAGEGFVPGCGAGVLCNCGGGGGATGACCQPGGCSITTADACATAGGNYLGDNTACNGPDVPGNSYTDNPGVAIPDGPAGTVSDTITVPDSFIIGDLNVDLGIQHTWVGDLVVTIEHNGTSVTIVDQMGVPALGSFGCDQDNLAAVVIDDEGTGGAIESMCQADLTSPPNYVPNNPLSAFDGMNASGIWTITVTDSAAQDTGSLEQWSLHFGTPGPSACVIQGACCLSPTTCVVTTPGACTGTYLGDNTNCSAAGPVTVYTADPNAAIPDAPASPPGAVGTPLTNVINVPDSYTMADVDVDLVVNHTWVGDLIISVEHGGTTVVLVDRPGFAGTGFGCGADNYNVIVDDQGTGGTIENLCGATTNPPSPPNYIPNNPLSAFNGMNSSGPWTISLVDNANLDTGSLVHWSLHLTQPGAGPCANIAICGNGVVESGEECDGGACCTPNCTFVSAGTVCHPSAGDCDVAESCSGSSATCPPDAFSSGNVCRPSTGPCDPAESCSGNGPNCPPNVVTTSCVSGDGCCPSGCNNVTDGDCPAVCGNGVAEAGEECDGSSGVCESGVCLTDCTCEPPPTGDIPTMSEWGLAVLALLLLIGGKLYFSRREMTA